MEESVAKALNEADWEDMLPKLMAFSHRHMCFVLADFEHKPVINSHDPESVTQEAIRRTVEGSRQWDPGKINLLEYLFGVIRSIIDCEMKKHCKVDFAKPILEDGRVSHPAEKTADNEPNPRDLTEAVLIGERQRAFLDAFFPTIEDDDELSAILLALLEGHIKPKDIFKQTGIPAARVSELKRKLRDKMEAFAGGPCLVPLEKNITLMET